MNELQAVFTLVIWLGSKLPRFFPGLAASLGPVTAILTYLPYFISIGQNLWARIQAHEENQEIENDLKRIDKAFNNMSKRTIGEAAILADEVNRVFEER